jgi:anti-sigma B factor antagonist
MLQELDQPLHIRHQIQENETVVSVAGDLHLPNVGQFREALQVVIDEHAGEVVLDFRQVGFLDSAGLKTLLDIRKQLSLQSRAMNLLLGAASQPDRVLHTTRVNTIITLVYE